MALSGEQLGELDWSRLVAESESSSCDNLHRTLSRWLRNDDVAVKGPAKAAWLAIEPILALFIEPDPEGECGFVPHDLLESIEVDLLHGLVEIVDRVGSADLRARVLDLAWAKRACDYSRVSAAVQAYVASANERFDPHDWLYTFARLKRSIEVASSIGPRQEAVATAVAAIEAAIQRAGAEDPLWLTHRLMGLLLRFGAGDADRYANLSHEIAVRARQAYEGNGVGNGLECERERGYLEREISWRRRLDDDAAVRVLSLEVAEAFVRQADGVIAAPWPNAKAVAVHFIGCAIERLRQLGGEGAKVDALRLRQQSLQRESVADMKSMSTNVDVTDAARAAKAHVSGKPPMLALLSLAFLHEPSTIAAIKEEVRLQARRTPFQSLVPQSYLGPRGTVLAGHSGILNGEDDGGFRLETMRVAHVRQSWAATFIHLAAEQIRYEHGLDTPWFTGMARASAFVPAGRERSFGRGLAAGLRGDYDLAALILCPQFEHAARELFFAHGIVTATLPSSGLQNEFNLNQLLGNSRASEVFGEDLAYDLRVLLTEKAGGNLRNDLLHGLLDDEDRRGAKVYFWWICLRLVMQPLVEPVGEDEVAKPTGAPVDAGEEANT